MYYIKYFLLFFVIYAIYTVMTLFFENSSYITTFMVLAVDNPSILNSSLTDGNFLNTQKSDANDNKSSKLVQQLEQKENCPPKPTALERDPRNPESLEPDAEPAPPIRIKVPTVTNTGSTLLIEGNGFIPLEQVRIELYVDWLSNSPEFKDKSFFQCKMEVTDSSGSFTTTLQLPETPIYTTGTGKYSIIGMESRQEKIATGSFITSDIKISSRQEI
jgi:hypothetical protein